MDVLGSRSSSFWTKNDFLFNMFPGSVKTKYNKTLEVINKFSNDVIRKRHAYLMDNDGTSNRNSEDESTNKIVFVDLLLRAAVDGQPLGNDAILDQVNTLTFNVSKLEL